MERASAELLRSLLERYNAGELSVEQFTREYYEAGQSRSRLEKIMGELRDILRWGQQHLRAWREVYRVVHSDDADLIDLAFRYFVITAVAHLQMAALQAAKLTERNADSVNLHYFFNVLANEGKDSFPGNWQEVRESVETDRLQLLDLQATISRIKAERDRRIAHHDRSIVTLGADEVTRIEATELDGLFGTIQKMLDKYHTYYYGTPPDEGTVTEGTTAHLGPEGLEDLLHLARRALDDESINDVSDHVRRVRAWRRALRAAQRTLSPTADDTG